MKKAFYILVLFAISLITGCKVTGDYFIGNGFCNTHLTLKGDSSFIYKTFADVGGTDTITGRWSKNKGMIILNSSQRPKFKPNSVYEKTVSSKTGKLIIVRFMDVGAYSGIISINDGQEIDTLRMINDTNYFNYFEEPFDLTGAYTHLDSIKNIRILKTDNWTDCILRDSLFKVSNPLSNLIIIYAQPYNHYWGMKYFVDTEWRFRHNRIYTWRKTKTIFDKSVFLTKKKVHLYKSGELP